MAYMRAWRSYKFAERGLVLRNTKRPPAQVTGSRYDKEKVNVHT